MTETQALPPAAGVARAEYFARSGEKRLNEYLPSWRHIFDPNSPMPVLQQVFGDEGVGVQALNLEGWEDALNHGFGPDHAVTDEECRQAWANIYRGLNIGFSQ